MKTNHVSVVVLLLASQLSVAAAPDVISLWAAHAA
jgi:hypothetical protein